MCGLTIGDARVQGSLVDLSALVVAHGSAPTPADVTIEESGRPVDVRHLVLPADGTPQRITARVAPSRESPTVYSVSVSAAEGEITTRNNSRACWRRRQANPRRVLVVEGAPAFEHGFLKRALEEDPGLEVDAVVRKGSNQSGDETFYVQADAGHAPQLTSGFPSTKAALFRYDAVVLANVDAGVADPRPAGAVAGVRRGARRRPRPVRGAIVRVPRSLVGTPLEDVAPVELVDRAGGLARVSAIAANRSAWG